MKIHENSKDRDKAEKTHKQTTTYCVHINKPNTLMNKTVIMCFLFTETKVDPEDNKQEEEKKKKVSSDESEYQHLMGGGRNKKEGATMDQHKGGENKTLTLTPGKTSEEIPLEDLQRRGNGQKYSEGTETTHEGNQREISVQNNVSEKQEDNKLPSERVQRTEQLVNPSQDTKPKSHNRGLTKDTEMLNDKKIVSTNRDKFSVQSDESKKKPQADSQRAQRTKQRDTSVLNVAHGQFLRF